jgi:hypothetical protein
MKRQYIAMTRLFFAPTGSMLNCKHTDRTNLSNTTMFA